MSEENGNGPLKPAPDWEAAKVLFCRGVRRAQICKEVGVTLAALDQRVTRGKWVELRDRLNDPASSDVAIETRQKLIREGLVIDLQQSVQTLPQIPQAKNARAALTRAQALGQLADVADKVFGGVAQQGFKLDIALLEQTKITASPIDPERHKDCVRVEYLPNGFVKLTQNGKSWIEDDRHRMPHPDLYQHCKPPRIIDVPAPPGTLETDAPAA